MNTNNNKKTSNNSDSNGAVATVVSSTPPAHGQEVARIISIDMFDLYASEFAAYIQQNHKIL